MLVFIDESGCSGFKLARGSDAVFVIGMVMFEDGEAARATQRQIESYRQRTGHRSEIRFSCSSDRTRDAFFEAVRDCPFKCCALIVEKDRVRDGALRVAGDPFYGFFVAELIRRAANRLVNVKVNVDGVGGNKFQQVLTKAIRRELPNEFVQLRLLDSRRDDLIQLADMCVGAIARAARDPIDGDRWLRVLGSRVENVWRFR
jgi:hypothetical protein